MSDCRNLESLLAPYVDGETEPRSRAAVEEHLGSCPPCRNKVNAERAAKEVLRARRDGLRACAGEHLRRRCAAQRVNMPVSGGARPGAAGLIRRTLPPLAMAASLLLVVGMIFFLGLNRGVELLAAQLAVDHVKCHHFLNQETHPDPKLLSREWKQERGWSLNIPASAAQYQLELLGLRRCASTEGQNAHIMYKWHGTPLSVYVMNYESSRASDLEQVVSKAGQDAIVWNENGRTYAVVAKGSRADLSQVVQYVKLSSRQ